MFENFPKARVPIRLNTDKDIIKKRNFNQIFPFNTDAKTINKYEQMEFMSQ